MRCAVERCITLFLLIFVGGPPVKRRAFHFVAALPFSGKARRLASCSSRSLTRWSMNSSTSDSNQVETLRKSGLAPETRHV